MSDFEHGRKYQGKMMLCQKNSKLSFINYKGFTLIEIMVAITIIGIITTDILLYLSKQRKILIVQQQVLDMQHRLRAGLEAMIAEIRMAGYDPYDQYNAGIMNAGNGIPTGKYYTIPGTMTTVTGTGPLTLSFVKEKGKLEIISFEIYDAYSDGDIDIGRRSGIGNHQPFIENIRFLNFSYFDRSGNPTIELDKIASVHIDLSLQCDDGKKNFTNIKDITRSISTMVYCRNLNL